MWSGQHWTRWAALGVTAASIAFAAGTPAGSARWTQGPPQHRPQATTETKTVVLQPATEDGFDWLDAGIGCVVAVGLALVTAGISIVLLRRPQQRAPLPSTPNHPIQRGVDR